jgi:hypothetical protein
LLVQTLPFLRKVLTLADEIGQRAVAGGDACRHLREHAPDRRPLGMLHELEGVIAQAHGLIPAGLGRAIGGGCREEQAVSARRNTGR